MSILADIAAPDTDLSGRAPIDWDAHVETLGGGYCQTVARAGVLQAVEGATPLYVTHRDGDRITGCAQLVHRIPYDRRADRRTWSPRDVLKGRQAGWLDCQDGPGLALNDNTSEALSAILDTAAGYARSHGLHRVRFAPLPDAVAQRHDAVFEAHGFVPSPWATYRVDLSCDEETVWAGLNKAARKAVRKAAKLGVTVHRARDFEDFAKRFHAAYVTFEESAGRRTQPLSTYASLWDADTEGCYRFYTAETEEGSVIGTLGIYIFNGVATEIASGMAPEAYEQSIPAQDILHWEIMRDARTCGVRTFDLSGVNPDPQTPKEAGIRRFKEKWGGAYVPYNVYVKNVGSPVGRTVHLLESMIGG